MILFITQSLTVNREFLKNFREITAKSQNSATKFQNFAAKFQNFHCEFAANLPRLNVAHGPKWPHSSFLMGHAALQSTVTLNDS